LKLLGLRKETRMQMKEFTMRKTKFSCFFTIKAKYSVFSLKHSFEEKHIFEHLVMKFIDIEISSWLLVIIGHFDTFFYETLMKS